MRILHLADVHLDRPFVGLASQAAARRRGELFATFRRCLALAKERDADLVTIGGDLREEEHVTADTRNSVCFELDQLAIPVLIACGNHDPLIEGGSYLRTAWPSNVTLAGRSRIAPYEYDGTTVWAVSWGGGDLSPATIEQFSAPQDGRRHVLLVHGTSRAAPFAEEAEAYCSFDPRRIGLAGLAVCLAGHIHAASYSDGVVYPGSPEPLNGAERGRHCVALVDVQGDDLTVELVDVNQKRYERREVDCSGCASSAEIDAVIGRGLTDSDPQNVYLTVRLVGEIDPECVVDPSSIARRQGSTYAALVVEDRTEPMMDIDFRANRKGLDGLFVRKLRQRIEASVGERDRHTAELALQAGLRAIDNHEVILRVG